MKGPSTVGLVQTGSECEAIKGVWLAKVVEGGAVEGDEAEGVVLMHGHLAAAPGVPVEPAT